MTRPESKDVNSKRPYASPRLVEYGSVTKLTANNGSITPNDAASGMMMGSCL
ncbi:MAG: lasso RiPP family leader peptide-containing protein [Candidatus Binataceae bacterium]